MSIFSNTPITKFKANRFDLSHTRVQSMDGGYLYPAMVLEMLPGSSISTSAFPVVRLQPMLSPMYQKVAFYVFDFAVPIRILNESQETFEKWWANTIPTETSPVAPYFQTIEDEEAVIAQVGSLSDYLGLPTNEHWDDVTGTIVGQYGVIEEKINAYIHAAYQKICTDHFRDENFGNFNSVTGQAEDYPYLLTEGWNDFEKFKDLRRRAWQHDYFTSALPWVQKGPSVALPIADFEDVDVVLKAQPHSAPQKVEFFNGTPVSGDVLGNDGELVNEGNSWIYVDPNGTYEAKTSELSNSSLITVNALRYQLAVQHYLEANARGGTRYIELIRQHFRVESSDKRLQRAEFISASEHPIIISEVLQTNESTPDGTPQGNMAGHGMSAKGTRKSRYFAEEHCIFMRIVNIRPKTSYSQGIHKMFSRLTPLDYGDPVLANLGEQAIKNKELFYTDDESFPANDDWGYIPQFSEYKYKDDSFAGDFRTNLAYWHMGRLFNKNAPPKLNEAFIECVPTKRVFAVNLNSNQPYLAAIHHKVKMKHLLSKYGVPGIQTV